MRCWGVEFGVGFALFTTGGGDWLPVLYVGGDVTDDGSGEEHFPIGARREVTPRFADVRPC